MGKINHLSKQECYDILNEALKTGADFAEVFMEDTVNYSQEMISCQTTKCNTSMVKGAAFRICLKDVVVNATTTDLSYENLMNEAKKLASNFNGVQTTKPLEFNDTTNNKIVNINDERVYDDATPLLDRASKAALAVSKEVVQTVASVSKKNQHIFVFASDSAYAKDHRCNTRISITVVASDGKNMQSINSNAGGNKAMEQYDGFDAETFGRETAESAITMLHADEMVGGEIPVVIHNGFGGVILHEAAVHGLEATSVARGMSVFCGKIGEKIGSDIVNAVDTGIDAEAWGSLNVDDEGTPTKRNLLIENGILKSYLVDKHNSKKMNHPITASSRRESYKHMTTSRMTNTYFLNGESTFEEIIANTKYGLFAKRMGGGSVNPATGEFNFAVNEGYMIEDGKITKPVRGATLVGSGKDVLLRIDMIANNLAHGHGMCGSMSGSIPTNVGQPTIRVSKMTVGGKGSK